MNRRLVTADRRGTVQAPGRMSIKPRMIPVVIALLGTSGLASPALAQLDPDPNFIPPPRQSVDANGVDLSTGYLVVSSPAISIGSGAQTMSYQRVLRQARYNVAWSEAYLYEIFGTPGTSLTVTAGERSITFNFVSSAYVNQQGSGETLTGSGSNWTLTLRDGTVVQMDATDFDAGGTYNAIAIARTITFPNKQKLTFGYKHLTAFNSKLDTLQGHFRIQSVQSSSGYLTKFEYANNTTTYNDDWSRLTKSTLVNSAVDYCNPSADTCSFSKTWPSLTFSKDATAGTESVSDTLGRTTVYTTSGWLTAIRRPTSSVANTTIAHQSDAKVTAVTTDGRTWTYAWSLASNLLTATVTNPDATQRVMVSDTTNGQVKSETNERGFTTNFTYDSNGRLTDITYPEGNKLQFGYDARGNVTERRRISKTAGTPADIVISASFPASCTVAVTCNLPVTTTNERGFITDYTYDTTHGGVLTVTRPPPTTGATRPQQRFGYTALQAYYKNSGGSIVASGVPTYLLTSTSACATLASCGGAADEVKSVIGYGPQSAGTANNLLPLSTTSGSGDGVLAATTSVTYDDVGNATYLDGPLSGAADTSRTLYDLGRQVVGTISADPDGAGALVNRATRVAYNLDGNPTKVERGTTTGQSDINWAAFAPADAVDIGYEASGRETSRRLSRGGTTYALSQTSYDANGRLHCSTVRTNPATFATPPADACIAGAVGSDGPDRISQVIYNPAGQPVKIEVAVGTAEAAYERTLTYNNNGRATSLKDAENNLTTYEYDGFDRMLTIRYPSPTKGSGTSSATDYEQLGYDAASNVSLRRLRDGQAITYDYDNLDRVIIKNLPGAEPDVAYAYDNLDRLTTASQTGNALSFTYDALSRNLTQVGPQGTATSVWDLAGRRTRFTYPGAGLFLDTDYLVTGEVDKIRENGATSGIGVLAAYAYDALGNRTSATYGNGTGQTYAYDPVSRLTSLTANLFGANDDLTIGSTSFNPASQITNQTRSNDAYAWNGIVPVNRPYVTNGLNQYTQSGSIFPTYDTKGNLTSAGPTTYGYSSENLLTSSTGGSAAILSYDPGMRLYQVAGPTTTRFAYDGLDLIAEYDASNLLLRRIVFGPGTDEPIVWYEGASTATRRWLHADERGSIIAVSDASGAVFARNSYDEYGVPSATNVGRFQYTGQAWLPELGMQYSKARIYSPALGRFLQTDPIDIEGGVNLYAYVGGDPINLIDPFGLADVKVPTIDVLGRSFCEAFPAICIGPAGVREAMRKLSEGLNRQVRQEVLRELRAKFKEVGKKAFCEVPAYNLAIDAGLFRGLGARVNAGITYNTSTGQLFFNFTYTGGVGYGAGVSFGLAGQSNTASAGNYGSIDSIGSGGYGRIGGSASYNWVNVNRGKPSRGSGFAGSFGVGTKKFSGAYAAPLAISLNYSSPLPSLDTPCD